MDTHMERTQVYLSKDLKKRLHRYAERNDSSMSELLRQAALDYLDKRETKQKKDEAAFLKALNAAAGIWKDRDPKEFEETRRSWDRRLDEWGI